MPRGPIPIHALLLGLLALAIPASAQGQAPVDSTATASSPALERLLGYIINETDVIESATANFDVEFDRNFKSGGGDAAEARFPGISGAIKAAGRQEMIAILRDNYPGLRANVTALVSQSLTPRDIEQANVFYGSPTGRKLVRAANTGARGADVSAIVKSAQDAAVGAMSPADNAALDAFARSDVFPKINALGPRMVQSSADWANTVMTREAKRLQQAAQAAGAAHIASLQPQPGK